MNHEDDKDPNQEETASIPDKGSLRGSESERLPHRLGPFLIESFLGEGGMGAVYRAYDESMKRIVAVKTLHKSLSFAQPLQIRFAREAWIAGQLNHDNIVRVFTRGEDKGIHYFAMEYIDGGSLAQEIERTQLQAQTRKHVSDTANDLYLRDICTKFVALAEALDYVHSKGFIHRDIKPKNILVSGKDRRYKLADFGIARAEDMTKLTKAGEFMGTVHYMSPELLTAHRATVDKRTDIYSLGVTLYEALTLTIPFEADSEEKLITEILTGHRIPPRHRNKAIPHDLETILLKATNQDADRRYQTADEFAEDLQRFLSNRPILARRERLHARTLKFAKRHVNILILGAVSVALLSSFVYLYSRRSSQEAQTRRLVSALTDYVVNRHVPPDIFPLSSGILQELINHLTSGATDTLSTLFLKAIALDRVELPTHGSFQSVQTTVSARDIPLSADSLRRQDFRHALAIVSTYELSFDGSPFKRFGEIAKSLIPASADLRIRVGLNTFFNPVKDGRYPIVIRRISRYYKDATMYRFKEHSASGGRGIDEDSLEEVNCSNAEPLVFTSSDRLPATPTFVDSSDANFSVWIMQQPPDDYPRAIHDDSLKAEIEKNLIITRVEVTHDDREYFSSAISFEGCINRNFPVPIAAQLRILDRQSGQILMGTFFSLSQDRFSLSASGDLNTTPSSLEYSPDSSCITSAHFGGIELYFGSSKRRGEESNYDRLVERGQFDASLVLVPDRLLAYSFGNTDEFFGDTLRFNISLVCKASRSQ